MYQLYVYQATRVHSVHSVCSAKWHVGVGWIVARPCRVPSEGEAVGRVPMSLLAAQAVGS